MIKCFLVLLFTLISSVAFCADSVLPTEPNGNAKVQVFAPSYEYDAILAPTVTPVSVVGYFAVGITSSTDYVYWKSNTNSRAGKVPIRMPGGMGTTVLGVHKNTKFLIFSGATGTRELN